MESNRDWAQMGDRQRRQHHPHPPAVAVSVCLGCGSVSVLCFVVKETTREKTKGAKTTQQSAKSEEPCQLPHDPPWSQSDYCTVVHVEESGRRWRKSAHRRDTEISLCGRLLSKTTEARSFHEKGNNFTCKSHTALTADLSERPLHHRTCSSNRYQYGRYSNGNGTCSNVRFGYVDRFFRTCTSFYLLQVNIFKDLP